MINKSPIKFDSLILETRGSIVSRISSDVLLLKFKTDQFIVKKEAMIIDENLCKLADNKPHYFIIDALGIQSNMDSESLKFFSNESKIANNTHAAAILLNNLPIRLTASIFIKIHKPKFKTATFKRVEGADDWFEKLRNS